MKWKEALDKYVEIETTIKKGRQLQEELLVIISRGQSQVDKESEPLVSRTRKKTKSTLPRGAVKAIVFEALENSGGIENVPAFAKANGLTNVNAVYSAIQKFIANGIVQKYEKGKFRLIRERKVG